MSELSAVVAPVKDFFTGIIDTARFASIIDTCEEFLSGVTTPVNHSKTVKAPFNGVVDTREKFITGVNDV
jgi:hypothetical protein